MNAHGGELATKSISPESYPPNCVVYSGTHANDTTVQKSSRLTTCTYVRIETCATKAAAFSMNAPTISFTRKARHA